MTGYPFDAQFKETVRNKTIKNCPIKPKHIGNAHTIFGSSIAGVRGKTTHRKPEQVEVEPGQIPDNFHRLHQFVLLTKDIMFVNGIAFLIPDLGWEICLESGGIPQLFRFRTF
jgi:hypothetical protein